MQHQVTQCLCSSNTECMAVVCDLCMCNPACLFQEMILRDPSSGWDLGPDLDHFSSRTRHVLQYMNPNKINMDLLVELIAYLGTKHHHARVIQHRVPESSVKCLYFDALPDKSPQFVELDGAILVFLPGLAHIQQLYDLLSSDKRFKDKNRWQTQTDVMNCNPVYMQNDPPPGETHRLFLLFVYLAHCGLCPALLGSGLSLCTRLFRQRTRVLLSQCHLLELERYFFVIRTWIISKQNNQSNVIQCDSAESFSYSCIIHYNWFFCFFLKLKHVFAAPLKIAFTSSENVFPSLSDCLVH